MKLYVWYITDYGSALSAVAVAGSLREARLSAAVTVKSDRDVIGNSNGPELLDHIRKDDPDYCLPVAGRCAAAW